MSGYISLHRKLLDNPIFYKPVYLQVWCYILLRVNHKDSEIIWNGEKKTIKAGSGIFSQKKISEDLKVSIGTISNILKYLNSERQIEIKSTSKFTEIQVLKWEEYQYAESNSENKVKTKRKQNETNNNDNNDNNINIEKRKSEFYNSLLPFLSKYPKEFLRDFYEYWTEHGPNDKKFRMEKQDSFCVERRLKTWKKNEGKFAGKNKDLQHERPTSLIA